MWQKRVGRIRNDSEGAITVALAVGLMVVLNWLCQPGR